MVDTILETYTQYSTGNPVYDCGVILIAVVGFGYILLK